MLKYIIISIVFLFTLAVKCDEENSLKFAADGGDPIAQFNLGTLYNNQDKLDLAENYWKMASDNGGVEAQYNLGVKYYNSGDIILAKKYF